MYTDLCFPSASPEGFFLPFKIITFHNPRRPFKLCMRIIQLYLCIVQSDLAIVSFTHFALCLRDQAFFPRGCYRFLRNILISSLPVGHMRRSTTTTTTTALHSYPTISYLLLDAVWSHSEQPGSLPKHKDLETGRNSIKSALRHHLSLYINMF